MSAIFDFFLIFFGWMPLPLLYVFGASIVFIGVSLVLKIWCFILDCIPLL